MRGRKKVLFIYGPTASGKTALAEKIAALIPAEIINMDSAQVYTPLSIGTAKPAWKTTPFRQHFFDRIDRPENTTVHAFREDVEQLIQEIHARGNLAICVGGSGFYLKSLLFKLASDTTADAPLAYTEQEGEDLWAKLAAIDPERAAQIHPSDRYRLQRALAIWFATGTKPSAYKPTYEPVAPGIIIHVTRDRNELYERINERVSQMIESGWIDEVRSLLASDWEPFLMKKGLIGYAELIRYLQGEISLEDAVRTIRKRTRNYAKRQETFWRLILKDLAPVESDRKGQPAIELRELNLTYTEIDLYIKQLLHDIFNKTTVTYEPN